MRHVLMFFSIAIAYFLGSWVFLGLINIASDANQRFVIIFFVMPIAFLFFTAIVQYCLRCVSSTRSSYFLHISIGAFTGLACFLFSLDGLGQLRNSESLFQVLSQFSLPAVGAITAGVGALVLHVATRVLQPPKREDNS